MQNSFVEPYHVCVEAVQLVSGGGGRRWAGEEGLAELSSWLKDNIAFSLPTTTTCPLFDEADGEGW